MRIYVETTHSPNIMKFVCDEMLTNGSLELDRNSDAEESLLAQNLLQFPFVQKVYISANFVALQKIDEVEWEAVVGELKEIINTHLENGTILTQPLNEDPYTLYAEMTPNPEVMKFVSNKILTSEIVEINSSEEADLVPIAKEIFGFRFVKEVFIYENYISITKTKDTDWNEAAAELRQFILEYLQSGKEIISENYNPAQHLFKDLQFKDNYSETENKIKQILKDYIQPAVANDGGNIELIEFDESSRTAKMLLQGACSGCPSSTMTLKNGIESILKQFLPGVVERVEAVNG